MSLKALGGYTATLGQGLGGGGGDGGENGARGVGVALLVVDDDVSHGLLLHVPGESHAAAERESDLDT